MEGNFSEDEALMLGSMSPEQYRSIRDKGYVDLTPEQMETDWYRRLHAETSWDLAKFAEKLYLPDGSRNPDFRVEWSGGAAFTDEYPVGPEGEI